MQIGNTNTQGFPTLIIHQYVVCCRQTFCPEQLWPVERSALSGAAPGAVLFWTAWAWTGHHRAADAARKARAISSLMMRSVWFMAPIPPLGKSLNLPMSDILQQLIQTPNDRGI